MNLHEEIAKTAYELYEKSGYMKGRDAEYWLEAEKIVLTRHASQDIEEPEGEEPIIMDQGLIEEVEITAPAYAERAEEEVSTVVEGMETAGSDTGIKEDIVLMTGRVRPVKPVAAKGKKVRQKRTGPKSRERYH